MYTDENVSSENPYTQLLNEIRGELIGGEYEDISYAHIDGLSKYYTVMIGADPSFYIPFDYLKRMITNHAIEINNINPSTGGWKRVTPRHHDDIATWLVLHGHVAWPEDVQVNAFSGLTAAVKLVDPRLKHRPPWIS